MQSPPFWQHSHSLPSNHHAAPTNWPPPVAHPPHLNVPDSLLLTLSPCFCCYLSLPILPDVADVVALQPTAWGAAHLATVYYFFLARPSPVVGACPGPVVLVVWYRPCGYWWRYYIGGGGTAGAVWLAVLGVLMGGEGAVCVCVCVLWVHQ